MYKLRHQQCGSCDVTKILHILRVKSCNAFRRGLAANKDHEVPFIGMRLDTGRSPLIAAPVPVLTYLLNQTRL